MLSSTDHDKLQQIMQENPENEALINRLFNLSSDGDQYHKSRDP